MWRRPASFLSSRLFSSKSEEIPILYSFLQPSVFAPKWSPLSSSPPPSKNSDSPKTLDARSALEVEIHLQDSLSANDTDEAWKSFKSLTNNAFYPSKHLSNSLIAHLSSLKELHNLKRAFASTIFLLEKKPETVSSETIESLLRAFNSANTPAPAFAVIKSMFKNRFFINFSVWGPILIELSRKNGSFTGYLRVFQENCKIALHEKLDCMRPDLDACNAALEGCCCDLKSVNDAEKVIEIMSNLGVRPDPTSFGHLAYLYALKGCEDKIYELEKLMVDFAFEISPEVSPKRVFYGNLIQGYVESRRLDCVSMVILQALREQTGEHSFLDEDTYAAAVKGFLNDGKMNELAKLISKAQELEASEISESSAGIERSVGFGIVNACVNLGFLDKAHNIVDEMNAVGVSIGIGVYASILRAYCKERRTAEASQLVTDINSLGLKLDSSSYDALIDASMSSQDFQSAFSLFRDMREARIPDLKMSYLTIMTGLTENHRPELMAAFLDEVFDDPRIEIATHDWNSIIHAFCKLGRLEDARRTFRRMGFLRFQPNEQTYLSLINGYVTVGAYFNVLMLWTEVRKKISMDGEPTIRFDHNLVDAFLYAFVKGGFFDAAMQLVEKSQEKRVFVDKWRYKQAFMETHKKLKVQKLRRKNFRKMEALIAFKNWAGLNA
ncbi:pentatricopeptide repeat-containing protein At1g69290 [Aristolochia californica]|uniref:pentatricopeptide repeat-containing protein At1g69290 n=1 Tax=Aristolochia californica TaxID=171875 RepID=UPI0035D8E25B